MGSSIVKNIARKRISSNKTRIKTQIKDMNSYQMQIVKE